ncbi:receptor-like protein kinase 2 [Dorcoceras hygrometricum]|uniref:Receptor-like protein kinase 2 n=1 Tax=Dorcoceras hygrometricum TaxID=472368 RepID=A0A2Z7C2J4_9LAMI|nr:receptor-like protein kinase 2 [Dorcoceras hygrometricum]
MVKRLETSPHDPLGITDSACKNQLVVISVQYGPFNPYIPIRSTTIGKSRVASDFRRSVGQFRGRVPRLETPLQGRRFHTNLESGRGRTEKIVVKLHELGFMIFGWVELQFRLELPLWSSRELLALKLLAEA